MNCKYCGLELEEGVTLCAHCGMENAGMPELEIERPAVEAEPEEAVQQPETEAPKKKLPAWKIVVAAICGVLLLGIVVCAVLYGLGVIDFKPRENNIQYKDSYTVSDNKALKKADVVIATVGSQTLTNGELQLYYNMEILDFISEYSSYLSYFGLDYTKPLDEQYVSEEDGLTWQHMFIDNALNAWYTYAVLQLAAEDEGYVYSTQLQESLEKLPQNLLELAQSYDYETAQELIEADFGGASMAEGYLSYLSDYYIGMDYFSHLYEKMMPSQEEINAYFTDNQTALEESGIKKDAGKYVDVRHILIEPEGGTKNEDGDMVYTDAEWEACRVSAQAILDEWLAGAATEDTFAELANKHSADTGSNTSGGLYTQVTEGYMVTEFNDWIFDESREKGQYGLVKTEFGYHVMYFVGDEEIWISKTRDTMLQERVDAFLAEAQESWPMEVEFKKIVLGEVALS